jgi:rhamnogalacturonan endolyase
MGREIGSHGDALHVGAFDPDREGLHVFAVHEEPEVASVEYRDGATGENLKSFYAYKDAGRGVAANITSNPGYEYWGTGGPDAETGGGIYNVQGDVVADSFRDAGLSVNFALYWDGDLLKELLDDTQITKYNEETGKSELVHQFEGVVSNNGTKATPTLQADILGDWREEVLLPTTDSSELRIFSTTAPTDYRLYTLMHDTVYRMGIAWQNSGYNQPPHTGFYLGEDIKEQVLAGELDAPKVAYTNKPESEDKDKPKANPTPQPTPPSTPKNEPGLVNADNAAVTVERGVTEDGKNKVTVKVNKDRIK